KRVDSRYEPGQRRDAWRKIKFQPRQEFVVGGFSEDRDRVDALIVGYYENRKLLFCAQVRAGLNPLMRRELHRSLLPLRRKTCPFANLPESGVGHWGERITAERMDEIVWLDPKVVVEVAFTEWTRDLHLRHSSFVSVRTDKASRDVRR